MEDAFPFVFVFVIGGAIAGLVLLVTIFTFQQRRQVLEKVAHKFRGRLEYAGFFDLPLIRLRFQGTPAVLRYSSHGKQGWHTHFQITWPDGKTRCELFPQGALSGLRRLLGVEDIEIGSSQFDAAYYITGASRREVCELLSSEVQAAIFRLASAPSDSLFGPRSLYVEFKGGVLTVTHPRHLYSFDELERFIRLSAELFEAALHTRGTGITFLEPAVVLPEPDSQESRCQICGEPLVGDLVYCAGCKTPSHRECWTYFGGCSTYACGGKKFLVRTKRKKTA